MDQTTQHPRVQVDPSYFVGIYLNAIGDANVWAQVIAFPNSQDAPAVTVHQPLPGLPTRSATFSPPFFQGGAESLLAEEAWYLNVPQVSSITTAQTLVIQAQSLPNIRDTVTLSQHVWPDQANPAALLPYWFYPEGAFWTQQNPPTSSTDSWFQGTDQLSSTPLYLQVGTTPSGLSKIVWWFAAPQHWQGFILPGSTSGTTYTRMASPPSPPTNGDVFYWDYSYLAG